MARKSLKCPKCDRSFAMPAHLQRHLNSMHGAKRPSVRAMRKGGRRGRPPGRPPGRPRVGRPAAAGALGSAGASDLIGRMRDYHADLEMRRSSLESEITAVTSAIEAMGGSGMTMGVRRRVGRPPGKRGRPAGRVGRPAGRVGRPAGRVGRPAGRVGRPRGSGGREGSLRDFVFKAMGQTSAPMSPREIAAAVMNLGYKTAAKDLTKAVSNLIPQAKEIKRMGFGRYQL